MEKKGTSEVWQWWAGDNEERYSVGPCATREEAIAEAIDADIGLEEAADGPVNHLCLCEALIFPPQRLADYLDLERIIERAEEKADDKGLIDHEGDHRLFAASDDQLNDLAERLKRACDEWQQAHGLVFESLGFQCVRNEEAGTFVKVAPRTEPAVPFKVVVRG